MPKHIIKFEIAVNQQEFDLLCMAKSEQPDPQRMKDYLVRSAASLVRRMADNALKSGREEWLEPDNLRKIKWVDKSPAKD